VLCVCEGLKGEIVYTQAKTYFKALKLVILIFIVT
jgi:hypothetical protein